MGKIGSIGNFVRGVQGYGERVKNGGDKRVDILDRLSCYLTEEAENFIKDVFGIKVVGF